jgi:hypothetical protein
MLRFAFLAAYIAISAAVTIASKQILTTFNFPILLAVYQSILRCTSFQIFAFHDSSESAATIPVLSRWLLALLNILATTGLWISLRLNSIFIYESSLFLILPVTRLSQFLFHGQRTALTTLLALALGLAGLGVVIWTDSGFSLAGGIVALGTVVFVKIAKAQLEEAAKQFGVAIRDVESTIALPQSVIAVVAFLFVEVFGSHGIFGHAFHTTEVVLLAVGGALIVGEHSIRGWLEKQTTPGQAVESGKTACVLIASLVVFRGPGDLIRDLVKKAIGLALLVTAEFLFTVFESRNLEIEQRTKVMVLEEEDQIEPPVSLHVRGVTFQNADTEHEE